MIGKAVVDLKEELVQILRESIDDLRISGTVGLAE